MCLSVSVPTFKCSIMLSNSCPTLLKIPLANQRLVHVSIDRNETVQHFCDRQNETAHSNEKFTIDAEPTVKMDDLIKKSFILSVGNTHFNIHPCLSSMISIKHRDKVEQIMAKINVPITNKPVMSLFLDHLVSSLPEDDFSQEQISSIVDNAIKEYNPTMQETLTNNIKQELQKTEDELARLNSLHDTLLARAKKYGSNMILFGASMAAAQVGIFGYLIYGLWGWNDVEPMTYLTGAFYLSVSWVFYFRYREDWHWTSAHSAFTLKQLKKLSLRHGYDQSRVEFLQRYRDVLKLQLAFIQK